MTPPVPTFSTLVLERRERLLSLTLNRPDALNAFDLVMHDELPEALEFCANDPASDVIMITGAGRAFSAGGDLAHIERNAAEPERFDHEIKMAKRIVLTLIGMDKPVVCRMNGHAVGLGATIVLLCDIIFAAEGARIGDPHVQIGLAAGDGGALVWPERLGLARGKEFLFTGELLSAARAAELGLINHCVPGDELDAAVDTFCARLLAQPQLALRRTKALANLELCRVAETVLAKGLEWESETVRSAEHRCAVAALRERQSRKG